MKIRIIAICLFVLAIDILLACTTTQERPQEITARITNKNDRPVQLQIEISCDKSEVALNDLIAFYVKIFNLPVDGKKEDISVFNPLKLGTDGGLTITVVGPKGTEIFPKEETNGQTIPPIIDGSWPYFTLLTYHYV